MNQTFKEAVMRGDIDVYNPRYNVWVLLVGDAHKTVRVFACEEEAKAASEECELPCVLFANVPVEK